MKHLWDRLVTRGNNMHLRPLLFRDVLWTSWFCFPFSEMPTIKAN